MKQASLGALVAVIFFYLLRAGEPILIHPQTGLVVGSIWIYLTVVPFIKKGGESKKHAIGNIVISLIVTTSLALAFEMVTIEQVKSFEFFGTAAWLGLLLAIPSATFFDKMNIGNMYERWYFRKR